MIRIEYVDLEETDSDERGDDNRGSSREGQKWRQTDRHTESRCRSEEQQHRAACKSVRQQEKRESMYICRKAQSALGVPS